jgi:pyruvate,water dikinase
VPLAAVAGYLEVDFDAARDRAGRARETAIADAMARLPSDGDRERLTGILSAARDYVDIIEDRARWQLILSAQQRRPALALGRKLAAAGRLRAADDVFLLHLSELDGMATGSTLIPLPELERRELAWRRWATLTPPRTLGQPLPAGMAQVPMMGKMFGMGGPPPGEGAVLRGHPGSAGTAEGIARVLLDLDDADRLGDGEILVCPFTAPPWTPLFGVAAAVVTDAGGVLSHAAIAAREFAIPAVVGVQAATTRITDGARIRVDGAAGTVEIVA